MSIKKKLSAAGASLIGIASPLIVFAALGNPLDTARKDVENVRGRSGIGQTDLPSLIGNIINAALGFMGIILLGYLLYAGFLWMTSGGEDKKVEQAKIMIRNAIVGIIIIIASMAISTFVLNSLVTVTTS